MEENYNYPNLLLKSGQKITGVREAGISSPVGTFFILSRFIVLLLSQMWNLTII